MEIINDAEERNGDDLLCIFSEFDIELRKLNPTVVKAWFDTDCRDTQKLLHWLAGNLTESNYLSSLHRHEFAKIESPIDSQKCIEELVKLDPSYAEIFQCDKHFTSFLKDEVTVLEEENNYLNELIKLYESENTQLSSDLALKTENEVQLEVDCKSKQTDCEKLCRQLDEIHTKLGSASHVEYDAETYLVNTMNMEMYCKNTKHFNFNLAPLIAHNDDSTTLENSHDSLSEDLEIYRNRIFHSYQCYLVKEVEIEKLKQISNWLANVSASHEIGHSLSISWNPTNFGAKDSIRRDMYETMSEMALKDVDNCLEQTKRQYIKRELEACCVKSEKNKIILKLLNKMLCYYVLTDFLQLGEAKHIERLSNFYQNLMEYVEKELKSCCTRTDQMNRVIEKWNFNLAKPDFEKFPFIATIAKLLNIEDCTLKAVAEAVGNLKGQLELTQSNLFCSSLSREQKICQQNSQNVQILIEFLTSGPTSKIILIPDKIRNACYLLEEHLKKERNTVQQAVNELQNMNKSSTNFDKYARQLWMNFLTNPSKVEAILKEAEQDFINRNKHYF